MATAWNNGGDRSTVDVQQNGPGNKWQVMDINASLDAPSGGGRARQTNWGRDEKGGLAPRSITYTGNPDDFTLNLMYPLNSENFLLKVLNCPFTIRARQYCAPNRSNMTGYVTPGMLAYLWATFTSDSFDNGIAVSDGQATDLNKTYALTAAIQEKYMPEAHDDISQTTSDVAYNRVLKIGADVCAGACGIASGEEDSWLMVTDRDAAPAYGGGAAPWLFYSFDRMVTRTGVRIGVYIGADALDVVLAGNRVCIFSDSKPPIYANLADIVNGVVDPNLWFTASGITDTGTNYPRYAVAVDSSTILAVGAGGRIWLSTDGGVSYTKIYDTAVLTTQNLNAIHAQPSGNAYVGGNAGTLIRLLKVPGQSTYSGSVVIVRDRSLNLLSSNINSVRTPQWRGDEVYLGTAGGEIWRTKTVNATKPVFDNLKFERAGVGSIVDMDFAGFLGNTLFILQAAVDSTTRVLRDFSGGNLGGDVEAIGDFVTPANAKINSIAAANVNFAITAGEVHDTYGFLGMVRPA